MVDVEKITGNLSAIQRCCTTDGPGIRTVVFLQGCPLHCPWCHNPEYRPFGSRISWQKTRCIACGRCQSEPAGKGCSRGIKERCDGCRLCESECPSGALQVLGYPASVEQVICEVHKDQFYYQETGGGVTLSGGEPLAQAKFAIALLEAAGKENMHRAIETSGAVPRAVYEEILERNACELFLYDIKCLPRDYPEMIGIKAEPVLENLSFLASHGVAIRLRVPLVEGWNVREEFLTFLQSLRTLPSVEGVDLLPWHDMGRGKGAMAGLPEADWGSMKAPDAELLSRWQASLL